MLKKATIILFFIVSVSGRSAVVNAQSIYLEWVDNPLKSMVINWIDDPGKNSSVEYREEGSDNWTSQNGNNRSIPGTSREVYTVKLTGLSAGQAYEFRVGGGSDVYKFRTAPDSLNNPIRFIVAGDILDNGPALAEAKEDFVKVSKVAATYDPYFVAIGGDLANANGDVNNVDQWLFLFEAWQEHMITDDGFMIPMVAALGNNEVPNAYGDDPDDAIFYYTFFRYPQDQWGSRISYGSLDFNEYLSIVSLDSDHTHRIPGTQTNWLNNTLKNRNNFRHVIPFYHVAGWPTFASRTLRGTQEDLVRNNWHKVFRNNKVRLAFEHHDHIYKRTLPIGDCDDEINHQLNCSYGNNAKDGVIYMGGGSWSSDNNRAADKRWYHDKVTGEIHNFVVVEITNNARTATAIGENNQVLDEFTDYVFLDPPNTLPPSNITPDSFTARWEAVEGATDYRLDVSTDPDFNSTFRSFSDKSMGNVLEKELENLNPAEIYYYRVRAQNDLTTSKNSETISVQLVIIDPDLSSLEVSDDIVVADNEETSTITATVIDEDGELVPNFVVSIFAEEGNLQAENTTVQTNEEGQAEFKVSNDRAEVVTYGVVAGNEEITEKVQVTFIPVPPVALAASNVENRSFNANWELVSDADYYLLDVSTDDSFSNTIPGHQGLDVGNVTSQTVDGVNPGTTYYYRVRAVTDDLVGVNSETISTTTFPDTPEATEASEISVISFDANWNAAEGAENYRLDVATDPGFDQFVEGYEDLDVGNIQTYEVEGLLPGRDYFYRVRAEAGPRESDHSNTIDASTFAIDTETSEINSAQLRVLANGDQTNEIFITVVGENGELQEGVNVQLHPISGSSQIEDIEPVTNEEGVATFGVTNIHAESVTYSVVAATVDMGEISVEFLQDEGILSLGNNFPNPFRFDSAIPLTIPRSMQIELRVYNSLGSPVRTLLNEEMETGYYEIPFNGADLAAGVYFYRMRTEEGIKTGKMVLVK